MKKKTLYRIEQFEVNGVINEIVVMAAMSNGGKHVSLEYMEKYVNSEKVRFPLLTDNYEATISGNTLLIDKGTKNLLAITEIEVFDLLDEIAPSLNRQEENANQEIDNGIVD